MKLSYWRFVLMTSLVVALGGMLTNGYDSSGSHAILEKNVILISWDGTQRAHRIERCDRGLLPNLKALSQAGPPPAPPLTQQRRCRG